MDLGSYCIFALTPVCAEGIIQITTDMGGDCPADITEKIKRQPADGLLSAGCNIKSGPGRNGWGLILC